MVNQIILDYLKMHSGKYKLGDLKNKMLSKGYPLGEINEAIRMLELKKDEGKNGFKWMKIGWIIGIIFLILGVLGSMVLIILLFFDIYDFYNSPFLTNPFFIITMSILFLLFFIGLIIFNKGFAKMGKFCESKFLRFSSIVFIFLIMLFIILILAGIIFFVVFGNSLINSLLKTSSDKWLVAGSAINIGWDFGTPIYVLIIGLLLLVLLLVVNCILFFIGLIKAGKKARFARIAGVLGIILFLVSMGSGIILIFNTAFLTAITSSVFGVFFIISIFFSLWCLELLFMTLSLKDASRKFEK